MKTILITIGTLFLLNSTLANNVQITQLTANDNQVTFDITWENSWRSGLEFHDAVWIFVKQAPNGGPSWVHGNIDSGQTDQGYQLLTPSDQVGVFLRRSSNGTGTASTQVQLTLENPLGAYRDFKVFAIEMVYVPEESFYIGDGWSDNSFHRGDDTSLSYHVQGEGPMTAGSSSNDFGGFIDDTDIPAQFPKGFAAFYNMKYPMTSGQYVDFLNCQDRAAQDSLTNVDVSSDPITNTFVLSDTYYHFQNPVRCDENVGEGTINFYCDLDEDGIGDEDNDGQFRGISRLRFNYLLAYLDWAGLAPMTCLEYEKSCRGPLPAVAGEYAWGSTTINSVGSSFNNPGALLNVGTADEKYVDSGTLGGLAQSNFYFNQYYPIRVGCNAPATGGNRELSNASYYGIVGLSSHMEAVIYTSTYQGQHGDGSISNGLQNSFGTIHSMLLKVNASTFDTSTNEKRVSSNYYIQSPSSTSSAGRGVRRI